MFKIVLEKLIYVWYCIFQNFLIQSGHQISTGDLIGFGQRGMHFWSPGGRQNFWPPNFSSDFKFNYFRAKIWFLPILRHFGIQGKGKICIPWLFRGETKMTRPREPKLRITSTNFLHPFQRVLERYPTKKFQIFENFSCLLSFKGSPKNLLIIVESSDKVSCMFQNP